MIITLRGVRGSIPTSGPETKKYGGNTSCVDVTADGWTLVLDGGSGMRQSNNGPAPPNKRVDILLTHLHLDHIQGLGFFKPLFDPELEVNIWGPASSSHSLHTRLSRYLSPPLFPVLIRDLPCKLNLYEVENSQFRIGPFSIQSAFVIHPGPTVGYRIHAGNSVFTFIPDHEPALGLNGMSPDPKWISGIDLAEHADLLLHDAQYSTEQYFGKRGWGHSSIEDALLFSEMAKVKKVLLGHHDPGSTDHQLEKMFHDVKRKSKHNVTSELAAEGMQIALP